MRESLTISTQFPADGPDLHFVTRLWRCEGGPTYHDHIAGPFPTADEANEALAALRGDQAKPGDRSMVREAVSIIAVGALVGVIMANSVLGMADELARGPSARIALAETQHE